MPVFFVKTNPKDHVYESYADYWTLVELSGYPIVYPDQIEDKPENCYIHTWFTSRYADWTNCKARHITWLLEWVKPDREELPKGAELWSSDQYHANLVNAQYVLFGSHPGLKMDNHVEIQDEKKHVILLQYMTHRRIELVWALKKRNITISENGWGLERHKNMLSSLAMLHVHQWEDMPTVAPQRYALAAAYGLPLITESPAILGDFDLKVFHAPYRHLANLVRQWVTSNDRARMEDFGRTLHQFLCVDRTFKNEVEAAL